ncbi:putative G-protein coupled receptor 34 [Aplochiton taeniatus]
MHTTWGMDNLANNVTVATAAFLLTNTSVANPDLHCVLDDSSLSAPLAWVYSLFFCLGLAGNLLALWVFLRVHSKKNSVRVFLINAAMADLLLVVCLPFRVAYHTQGNHWTLGRPMCHIVGTLFYMNMYISITLLGLISVDRYLKLHHSRGLHSRLQSTRWSSAICGVIWTFSIAPALAFIFFPDNEKEASNRCFEYKALEHAKWRAHFNFFLVAVFWLVFLSLVVSYSKIALKLLRTSRESPDLPNAARYHRTAKKSFFILFIFTVCFVPFHVVRVFYIVTQITSTSCYWRNVADRANEGALLFSTLNSCLDPVMYFLLSSSVRRETLRLVNNVFHLSEGGVSRSSSSVEPWNRRSTPAQLHRSPEEHDGCVEQLSPAVRPKDQPAQTEQAPASSTGQP